jgi:hypothetical protein
VALAGLVRLLCTVGIGAAILAGAAPASEHATPVRGSWGGSTGGIWHYLRFAVQRDRMTDIVVAYSCRVYPGLRGSFFSTEFPDTRVRADGSFEVSFGDHLSLRGRFSSPRLVRGSVNPTSNPVCADGRFAFSARPVVPRTVQAGRWRGADATGRPVSFTVTRDGFVRDFRDSLTVACPPPLPAILRRNLPLLLVKIPIRHTGRVIGKVVLLDGKVLTALDGRFSSSREASGTMSYEQLGGLCRSGVVRWTARKA